MSIIQMSNELAMLEQAISMIKDLELAEYQSALFHLNKARNSLIIKIYNARQAERESHG